MAAAGDATDAQRPARDASIQIAGRLGNILLGVVVTIVVVRLLGDERFGEWSSLLAVIALTGAVCDLGSTQVAVGRAAMDPPAEASWIAALVVLQFALSLVACAISAFVVVMISTSNEMRDAGLVLSATLLLAALGGFRAILQLRIRNDLFIAAITVNSVLWGVAAIAILAADGSLVALALGFFVALAVSNSLLVGLALRHGGARLEHVRSRGSELLRVGVPIALGSVLVLSYGRIDQILVFQLAGTDEAGLYAAAYRILDQAQFVPISIATTILPLLAMSYGTDVVRFRAVVRNAADTLLAFALGAFVFAAAYSEGIVLLLFGDEFESADEVLPILVAALIPISLGYLLGVLVIVTERQRAFVVVATVGLIFNVGLNLWLIPSFGFVAASWVTLATEVLVLTLVWWVIRSRLPRPFDARRTLRIAVAAVATLGLLVVFRLLSIPLGLAIVGMCVSYPVALFVCGAVSRTEIRDLVHGARRMTTT